MVLTIMLGIMAGCAGVAMAGHLAYELLCTAWTNYRYGDKIRAWVGIAIAVVLLCAIGYVVHIGIHWQETLRGMAPGRVYGILIFVIGSAMTYFQRHVSRLRRLYAMITFLCYAAAAWELFS